MILGTERQERGREMLQEKTNIVSEKTLVGF